MTGLRFFAAAAIVIHHLDGVSGLPSGYSITYPFGQGVSIFFVLSGFILTHVYGELRSLPDIKQYYVARFARVWPLHALMLLIVCVLSWLGLYEGHNPDFNAWVVLAHATLTHAFIPNSAYFFALNGVSWSISTEVGFYLLFPFLIHGFRTRRFLTVGLAGVIAVSIVIATTMMGAREFNPAEPGIINIGFTYVNPLARLLEFVTGMLVATFWQQSAWRTAGATRGFSWTWTVIEFFAVTLLMSNLFLTKLILGPWLKLGGPTVEHWLTFSLSPLAPSALLIFVLAVGRGAVSRFLGSRLLEYLGNVSFAVYMTHQVILFTALQNRSAWGDWPLGVYLGVVMVTSITLYHLVEIPARRYILR